MKIFVLLTVICLSEGFLLKRQSAYYPYQQYQGYTNQNSGRYYPNQRYPTGNQGYSNRNFNNEQSTTTMSPEEADAQAAQYMDPFVLLGHLEELTSVYQDGSQIIQEIQSNSSRSEAQRVGKIAEWYNALSKEDTNQEEVESFRTRFLDLSSQAATEAGELMNRQSDGVLTAWQQLTSVTASLMGEKTTPAMYEQQLNQIYNQLSLDDQTAFKNDFKQVYGYDYTPSTE